MPKIKVTPELGKTIRTERKAKGLHIADLATLIDKSVGFISSIENSKIDFIDFNTLHEIFEKIIEEDKIKEFMDKLLPKISFGLTDDEIEREQWMCTFDLQYRELPIQSSLIDYINNWVESKTISPTDIIRRMNQNEDLDNKAKYEVANKVYAKYENDTLQSSIKFDLEEDFLDNILSGKMKTINYINMLGIIYTIFKFEGFTAIDANEKARKLLYENKFYTLKERNRALKNETKSKALMNNINTVDVSALNPQDKENYMHTKELFERLKVISDRDVLYANSRLKAMCDNFRTDPSITLAIWGLSLSEFKGIEVEKKKQFINDVKDLIEKYCTVESNEIERLD
jgi:transcriptional regulator with XRE-family HTH domain